jgi:hypothetical protein
MNTQRQTLFLGRRFAQLGGDDQVYMQNLAHSLLFIQNSRSLAVEKRDGEAVIAVKPTMARERGGVGDDKKSEFVAQKDGV